MKNKIIILMLLGILLIPFVNSAIELNKDEYQLGETVLAKLSFNYAPDKLSTEHIKIYDQNGKSVLIPFFIVKFSNSLYYTYFTIPTSRIGDNYTLEVGPYYYTLGGQLQRNTDSAVIKIFNDRNIPILAVDPGAAVIDYNQQNYFYINLKNNGNTKIDLKLQLSEGVLNYNEYQISSGDSLKIKGTVNLTGEKLLQINYNGLSYKLPILVTGEVKTVPVSPTPVAVEEMPSDALRFVDPTNEIKVSVLDGQAIVGSINFKNFWTKDIKDVKLSLTNDLSEVLTLYQTSFSVVNPNQVVNVLIDINDNKNLKKDYSGEIKLTAGKLNLSYPVSITYVPVESGQEEAEPLGEASITEVETEKKELEKQKELKTGFLFSLLTLLFVIIIVLLIVFRARKRKPKDFIFSSRRH